MNESLNGYPADQADLNVPVPPWSYNPSAWSQRIPICLLATVACLMATHMALYQWRLIDSVWDPVFGDQSRQVLDSDVAKQMDAWIGIPDAALGALAYLGDVIFGLAGSTRRWQYRPWMVILFGIDVIPLGIVSAVLVVLFAVLSYWPPMRRAHLGTIAIAVLLFVVGRFVGMGPPDPARQNEIVFALLLAMFAIVPSRASEPPDSWYLTFRDRVEQV